MPFEVAPAPVPSWERGSGGVEGGQPEAHTGGAPPAVAKPRGLDAAFLCRLHRTVAWFGALATFLVAILTAESGEQEAVAFASGLLMGWGLLATQSFVVARALGGGKDAGKRSRRMLWWLLVPLKYLGAAALVGWMLDGAKLPGAWVTLGFGTVQVVMLAKAMGYVLSGSVRTVRQAHVRPGRD